MTLLRKFPVTLQGIHYGEMRELREDLEVVAATVAETRSSLPDRIYWKETTPQHYNQTHGEQPPVSPSMVAAWPDWVAQQY